LWAAGSFVVAAACAVIREVVIGWNHDAGQYMIFPSLISKGYRPWVDFGHMYLPLMAILDSIPLVLGMPHLAAVYFLPAMWLVLDSAATYWLAHAWCGSKTLSLWLTGFYLVLVIFNEGRQLTLEHGVVFFSCVALALLLEARHLRTVYFAGFALCCAVLSKQVGLISVIPFAAIALSRISEFHRRQFVVTAAMGFLTPIFLLLCWLQFDFKAIHDRFYVTFNAYGKEQFQANWAILTYEFARNPLGVTLLILALVLGLTHLIYLARVKKAGSRMLAVLGFMVATILYLCPLVYRYYPHYALCAWPTLALLLTLAIEPPWKSRPLIPWAAAGILLCGILSSNWDRFKASYQMEHLANAGIVYKLYLPVARKIQELVPPGSRILVLGDEPIIYFLSDTLPQDFDFAPFGWIPYVDYKDEGRLTVLVNYGQSGAAEKRSQLLSRGYQLIPHEGGIEGTTADIFVKPHGG
jgi:hypothetical protein